MQLVGVEGGAHWYRDGGEPCHKVPYADPSRGLRNTTVKDARKLGLVPSVTNVNAVIRKPALEAWKIEQAILASLTLPRLPDEGDDNFAKRVVADGRSVSKDAADLGTQVHKIVEGWLKGDKPPIPAELWEIVRPVLDWLSSNVNEVHAVEKAFGDRSLGFGGTIDLIADLKHHGLSVLDLKTQSTKKGRFNHWIDYGMQVSAYRVGARLGGKARIFNLTTSTTEPGLIDFYDWTPKAGHLWKGFSCALDLWCFLKNYDPREAVAESEAA